MSHEDELQSDSNSIINQRKIPTKHAAENRLTLYEFIYGDGYSGTNFERPAFSKMIEDVQAEKVASVVCKDSSRFGRDDLQAGMYREIMFSEMDVRFIAVNDNIDMARGENDFAPMMNQFNEWFMKNTSQKIRAVYRPKARVENGWSFDPVIAQQKFRSVLPQSARTYGPGGRLHAFPLLLSPPSKPFVPPR